LAPRSAVIDTGQRQVAFVSLGQGRFQPRDVEMGLVGSGDTVEILGGLSAGEQVVISGQFLLDSDSRMQEAVRQFLQGDTAGHSNHAEPATAPSTSHTSSSHDQRHH
jgi:Cu(I)/Ag(I) efflux system membrane fusion protein/cobalt-zinc-cadmium efflux system membrane fusion protein